MDIAYYLSKAVFKVTKNPSVRWKLKESFPEAFFLPHMKPDEYQLFKKICRDKKVFIEYGSGGSTIYLLKNNKRIFSVESNPEFFGFMNSLPLVRKSVDKNLTYKFVDLGATNKWGEPLSSENSINWPEYYAGIWSSIDPARDKVDVIFIDGRFRVSCCLYSILKVIEYNWTDTTFVIHDFTKREVYKSVLQFLEEVASSRTLASFKLKAGINVEDVKAKLEEYALVTK